MTLYYEMHVTIEYPYEHPATWWLGELKVWAHDLGWHMGDLLMVKSDGIGPSRKDLFFTNRANTEIEAWVLTKAFCDVLKERDHKVLRYKLEDTITDSNIADEWVLL